MRHIWTNEDTARLKELYPTIMTCEEISAIIGVSLQAVYNKASGLCLKKPEEYRSIAGKKGASHYKAVANRFKNGNIPANKGKKMSQEVYAKVSRTIFKPGNIPANHRKVGSERINKDGYVEIKVTEPNRWVLKHRLVWEETYGPIPRGCNIQFRNGNRKDVRIENLYIIDRKTQILTENSMIARYPVELQQVIRTKAALKRRITLTERRINNEQK